MKKMLTSFKLNELWYMAIGHNVGTANCTDNFFWSMDLIGQLSHPVGTENHEDCHFKFQYWSWDLKIEESMFRRLLFSLVITYLHTPNCVTNWTSRLVSILWAHRLISSWHVSILVSVLNYKPCDIPFKYRCPIKSINHVRPTYLIR